MTRKKPGRVEFVSVARTNGLFIDVRLSSVAFLAEMENGDWEVILTNFTSKFEVPKIEAQMIRELLWL